jgi:hypothetical protein
MKRKIESMNECDEKKRWSMTRKRNNVWIWWEKEMNES